MNKLNNFVLYLIGAPTNFGLREKMGGDWGQQIADETHGDYNTTYGVSYSSFPGQGIVRTRHATPLDQSTTLHKVNKVNKDLNLRERLDKPGLQSPQKIHTLAIPRSAPACEPIKAV